MAKAMMERLRIDGFDVKVVKHNIHGEDDTPCQLVIISPPAATQTLMLTAQSRFTTCEVRTVARSRLIAS